MRSKSPVVQAVLQVWKDGGCTWDQCMLLLVVELTRRNDVLEQSLADCRGMLPSTVVVDLLKKG